MLLYDVAWCQTVFECLFVEEDSILLGQPKFLFWISRTWITCEMSTNLIPRVFISGEKACKGNSWAEQKFRTIFETCGLAISCWKIVPGMPWRKGTTSGCITSRTYLLLLILPSLCSKLDRPWYEIALHTINQGVRTLCRSITHSVVSHGIVSNTNAAIMVPEIEAWITWKC